MTSTELGQPFEEIYIKQEPADDINTPIEINNTAVEINNTAVELNDTSGEIRDSVIKIEVEIEPYDATTVTTRQEKREDSVYIKTEDETKQENTEKERVIQVSNESQEKKEGIIVVPIHLLHRTRTKRIRSDLSAKSSKLRCDRCKECFTDNLELEKHTCLQELPNESDEVERKFACKICKKQFSRRSNLNVHTRIHSGERPFTCSVCQKPFAYKSSLTEHELSHSGQKPFSCSLCNLRFTRKYDLNRHERFHTEDKPFSCEICKKQFTSRYKLNYHKSSHSGEKPYQCNVCNKQFAQKCNLNRHELNHTGQNPFSCSKCKKQFAFKSSLAEHERSHSGEKPYTCEVCKKQFAYKSSLTDHIRIHSGENPFSCEICSKQFNRKSCLTNHKRNCQHLRTKKSKHGGGASLNSRATCSEVEIVVVPGFPTPLNLAHANNSDTSIISEIHIKKENLDIGNDLRLSSVQINQEHQFTDSISETLVPLNLSNRNIQPIACHNSLPGTSFVDIPIKEEISIDVPVALSELSNSQDVTCEDSKRIDLSQPINSGSEPEMILS